MITLIAIILLEAVAGAAIGGWLARRLAISKYVVLSAFFIYLLVAIFAAYIATLYPGPESRYTSDSTPEQIRSYIIAPTFLLWLLGPAATSFTVSYFRDKKRISPGSNTLESLGTSSVLSLFSLPIWFIGGSIHAANFSGAWF